MAEERTTTANSVWEVLDTLFYRVSMLISLGFPVAYFLLRYVNPPDLSFLAFLCDFLSALITSVVPVAWGYVLSRFFLLRHLQSIRSKQESDALATNIANKTQTMVVSELRVMQQKIDEVLEHAALGRTARALGVADITSDWTEFAEVVDFRGSFGQRLRKHLEAIPLQGENPSATWYIVTIEPEGMISWLPRIKQAVRTKGVDVKWVCPECLDALERRIKNLHHHAKESHDETQAMDAEHQKHAGHWELYESKVPHFYMAFLSVPGKYDPNLKQAPVGTFGFVHLYTKFPHGYHTRPGLYLEAPGQILDYYYWSTVQLFDEGVKRGYLWHTWPLEPKPDPERERGQQHGADLSN